MTQGLEGMLDELVRNPIYIVFLFFVVFLFLVIFILVYFLLKQNRVLARLETQMKGFTPESTNVITNQRLSAVFDQQPQFPQGGAQGMMPPQQQMAPQMGAPQMAPQMGAPQMAPQMGAPQMGAPQMAPQGGGGLSFTPSAESLQAGAQPAAAPSAPAPPQQGVLTQYQEGTGEGISEIENKLKDDPNNPDLLDWLAFMYYSNNKLEKAIEIYQRALNLNYENEHQHYYLGNSFYKKGIIDRAIEEWEVVISLKPNSKIANNAQERINKAKQALSQQ